MENYGKIIRRTWDNSYVINDGTYHVPNNEEFKTQWEQVHKYALANPNMVTEEYPYTPSLDELKKAKRTEVDQWTASKITGGFVSTCYNGENILYDTDTETQLTMTKARANCEGERFAQAFPNGMGVRGYAQTGTDADGTMVFANTKTIYNFLPEHIIAWDEDFSLHLAKCKYEGWIMQDKVNACTTKEELESIVLE
ncbi:MAG: hypothetical protein IKL58_00145 [Phascolarctobacterium sp.]|nr:hypothetical protein [Phascolarctobacterium sp.]